MSRIKISHYRLKLLHKCFYLISYISRCPPNSINYLRFYWDRSLPSVSLIFSIWMCQSCRPCAAIEWIVAVHMLVELPLVRPPVHPNRLYCLRPEWRPCRRVLLYLEFRHRRQLYHDSRQRCSLAPLPHSSTHFHLSNGMCRRCDLWKTGCRIRRTRVSRPTGKPNPLCGIHRERFFSMKPPYQRIQGMHVTDYLAEFFQRKHRVRWVRTTINRIKPN